MTTKDRESVREAVARGDLPEYVIRAYVEAGIGDASRSYGNPQGQADALQFAADLARTLTPFDIMDYIPVQDGIREAL